MTAACDHQVLKQITKSLRDLGIEVEEAKKDIRSFRLRLIKAVWPKSLDQDEEATGDEIIEAIGLLHDACDAAIAREETLTNAIKSILLADERGQGLPFQEAMQHAAKLVGVR